MPYHQVRVISGAGTDPQQFSDALRGVAVGPMGEVCLVGDEKLRVFSPEGKLCWGARTARPGFSVAVAADGRVFVGEAGQIEIFNRGGERVAVWTDAARFGRVTAIGFADDGVIVADVADRCLRRLSATGEFRNDIGKDNRMRGFLVPNGWLDFAVDADSVIHACNPAKHRVERYSLDGKLLGQWGRFDGRDPEGFGGCCNPTNLALAPGGEIVVTEKAPPRAKVYDADGKLRAVVGEGAFDACCKNMDVAVDGEGRLYVVDTVRRCVVVFAPERATTTQPATGEAVRP
ncbi:MAG: NHL repeat-containing protein [Phycisphaerae bacterium]|jgi:sugar lactone lactonase YvrE